MRCSSAFLGLSVLAAAVIGGKQARAQATYDFTAVTNLAQGALSGQNVQSPVAGFELLLVHKGRTVYQRAFGNVVSGEAMAADSATKTISGAVIMSVVENSVQPFTLDTRLSSYLPSMTGDKAPITLRQAFSHTSGIGGQSLALSLPNITLQQSAAQIIALPLVDPPGTTFAYGGLSMQVAGAAAEGASGQSWNNLFQQRLAGPLGLVNTRYVLASASNPRVPGGCESTAAEFARVMEMLRRRGLHAGPSGDVRVLQASSVDALFTRQSPVGVPIANTPLPGSSDYGVGVWLDRRQPDGTLEGALAAGARGFSAWVDFDDEMSGAFATDRTSAGNVLNLLTLIRNAAQLAVRSAVWCPADYNRDQVANIDDVFIFLNGWFAAEPLADQNADGVNIDDVFIFLNRWFAGC